jgi:hypothetical protein
VCIHRHQQSVLVVAAGHHANRLENHSRPYERLSPERLHTVDAQPQCARAVPTEIPSSMPQRARNVCSAWRRLGVGM